MSKDKIVTFYTWLTETYLEDIWEGTRFETFHDLAYDFKSEAKIIKKLKDGHEYNNIRRYLIACRASPAALRVFHKAFEFYALEVLDNA